MNTVEQSTLALGDKLGQGGQGAVRRVTNKKINEADGGGWDVVYKEYDAALLHQLDAGALASIVDLPGTLSGQEARWLCGKTAWPASVVEHQGQACGFLMRAVPDRFQFNLLSLTAGGAGTKRLANMEYLLNDDAYVAGIGLSISERDRLALLADLALTLARLHGIGITVGDLSPKNLLFTTTPQPECFLIDCDAMRLRGASVLPQVETPDWQIPTGEQKATEASDVYKFALLAIRLFARDQTADDPAALAAISPALSDLARAGLDADPARRPGLAAWAELLGAAVITASTAPATAAIPLIQRLGTRRPPRNPGGPARVRPAKPGSAKARSIFTAFVAAMIIMAGLAHLHNGSGPTTITNSQPTDSPVWPVVQTSDTSVPDPLYSYTPDGADTSAPASPTPPGYQPPPPSPSPSPTDALTGVQDNDCFYDNGTGDHAELATASCVPGAFQVVQVVNGTTDLNSCEGVTNNDMSVSSALDDLVVCLSYLSSGGSAYHAHQGDCVYGPNDSRSQWSTVPCQTGNFKVVAAYRGTTDYAKCNGWPHYDQWRYFTVTSDSGLDVLLCMSMNYPDDAGYATLNECLLRSGTDSSPVFTNVDSCPASNVIVTGRTGSYDDPAFCGQDASAWWEPYAFPQLGYTICYRWK